MNKPIKNITFLFKDIEEIYKLKNISQLDGETEIKVIVENQEDVINFRLKNKRKVTHNLINSLNLTENVIID